MLTADSWNVDLGRARLYSGARSARPRFASALARRAWSPQGDITVRSFTKLGLGLLLLGAFALATRNALAQEKAKVGDKAPKFEATDDQGKTWKSSDHVGKKIVVLYFYPADFTSGCTKQACGFRDDIEKLNGLEVEVVGVSGDSAQTHKLCKSHNKLAFTLLADEKGDIARLFGVKAKPGGTAKGVGVDESG